MAIIREVTNWDFPNHVYMTHNGRIVAYIKQGTTDPIWFSKPLRFEKSRRKFVDVKDKEIIRALS